MSYHMKQINMKTETENSENETKLELLGCKKMY